MISSKNFDIFPIILTYTLRFLKLNQFRSSVACKTCNFFIIVAIKNNRTSPWHESCCFNEASFRLLEMQRLHWSYNTTRIESLFAIILHIFVGCCKSYIIIINALRSKLLVVYTIYLVSILS